MLFRSIAAYYCYLESWTLSYVFHSLVGTFKTEDAATFFPRYLGVHEKSLFALPVEATFHEDRYHPITEAEVAACFEAMKSESGKFDWSASLRKYFAEGGEMGSREAAIRASLSAQGLQL